MITIRSMLILLAIAVICWIIIQEYKYLKSLKQHDHKRRAIKSHYEQTRRKRRYYNWTTVMYKGKIMVVHKDSEEYKNREFELPADSQSNDNNCNSNVEDNDSDNDNEPIGIADPIEKRYYWTTKGNLPVGFNSDDVQGKRYFRGHLYQGSEQFVD